jgi:hypothetical protein
MRTDAQGVLTSTPISTLPNPQKLSEDITMGRIVVELLEAGKNLNRKALCSKLLKRIEFAASAEEERHYQKLLHLVLERNG